jgi:hypothetical protein
MEHGLMISYKDTLLNGLNQLLIDFDMPEYKIKVYDEKSYQDEVVEPKTISVVIKYLTGTILYTSTVLPLQFMLMAEENSIEVAKMLIDAYAQQNNFKSITIDGNFVKQAFSTSAVVNNFNPVGSGFRSLLFMSATMTITGSVVDIQSLVIDTVTTTFISAVLSYNSEPDSQPFPAFSPLNTSVKRFASMAFSLQVPHTNSVFCQKVINIMRGNVGGNTKFAMTITLNNTGNTTITQNFLLVSANFNTTAGDLPTLQLAFAR